MPVHVDHIIRFHPILAVVPSNLPKSPPNNSERVEELAQDMQNNLALSQSHSPGSTSQPTTPEPVPFHKNLPAQHQVVPQNPHLFADIPVDSMNITPHSSSDSVSGMTITTSIPPRTAKFSAQSDFFRLTINSLLQRHSADKETETGLLNSQGAPCPPQPRRYYNFKRDCSRTFILEPLLASQWEPRCLAGPFDVLSGRMALAMSENSLLVEGVGCAFVIVEFK